MTQKFSSSLICPLYVQDQLLVFAVSRILGLASEPCRDLGLREPSYYQQSRLDLLLDADTGSGVTANGA